MPKRNYVKTAKVARSTRRKKVGLLVLIAAALYALWALMVGEMGVIKYYRMHTQERTLRAEIGHLKQDNLRLMDDVRSLKSDPAYLERMARDKIGLARPGEVVYYYGGADR